MQKILPTLVFMFGILTTQAQQVSLGFGKIFSAFDYTDSHGNKLKNLTGVANNYISVGYRKPIATKKWFLNTAISHNRYGARGSDPALGDSYAWDVSFLSVTAGADFEFFKQQGFFINQDGFSLYLKAAVSPEFMLQGSQTINNQVYSLAGQEQFNKPLFFLRGGVGASYCVSRKLALFLEYTGGKSMLLFGRGNDGEKLRYITHNFGFGMLLSMVSCKYCHTTL